MKKVFMAACVLFTCVLATGCSSTAGIEAVSLKVTGPNGETEHSNLIAVSNYDLARDISVVRVDRRDIGGLIKSSTNLRSRTTDTLALQYRWVWYDSYGMEVSSSTQSWQPLMVYGGQTTSVQGLAPNPSAKDFKLHLRYQD
jgi:uncharacterized protein YcfL